MPTELLAFYNHCHSIKLWVRCHISDYRAIRAESGSGKSQTRSNRARKRNQKPKSAVETLLIDHQQPLSHRCGIEVLGLIQTELATINYRANFSLISPQLQPAPPALWLAQLRPTFAILHDTQFLLQSPVPIRSCLFAKHQYRSAY